MLCCCCCSCIELWLCCLLLVESSVSRLHILEIDDGFAGEMPVRHLLNIFLIMMYDNWHLVVMQQLIVFKLLHMLQLEQQIEDLAFTTTTEGSREFAWPERWLAEAAKLKQRLESGDAANADSKFKCFRCKNGKVSGKANNVLEMLDNKAKRSH